MKFILSILLSVCVYTAHGQYNLLGSTEKEIKEFVTTKTGGVFDEASYTNAGDRVVFFKYPENDLILISIFYFTNENICFSCEYTYKNDALLVDIVDQLRAIPEWEKLDNGKIEFINRKHGWDVLIERYKDKTMSVKFYITFKS